MSSNLRLIHSTTALLFRSMLLVAVLASSATSEPRCVSGVYPHLAMYNEHGECGTGAVVPWADRLWVITYAPHESHGSSDKLYEIDSDLTQTIRPESVGGTPAGRMIHRESGQLFIGPYAIDRSRNVRVIPPAIMPGRLTAIARHLTEPESKLFYATMEEGFYEVDAQTLKVSTLYPDANRLGYGKHAGPLLPGYHGKGLYSGQGRLIYANNGEFSALAKKRPDVPSGVLAEWNGEDWRVVRRNQFCEVTGPGGIYGNDSPGSDPVWAIGWDHKSLILMMLDEGEWHEYRLPKGSHCYDGAHGWNTEWPRIRDIGEDDLLMTMHGLFWRLPRSLTSRRSGGIGPRSAYLKVIGDFCRWGDRVVMGCDDTAKNEFLNRRLAKGDLAGPGESHSNLWFVDPQQLDQFGPALGEGGVWVDETVAADTPSAPFLFSGFDRRGLHLAHKSEGEATFRLEVDQHGSGTWRPLATVTLPPAGYRWLDLDELAGGGSHAWLRLTAAQPTTGVTAWFSYANVDARLSQAAATFDPLANEISTGAARGVLWVRDRTRRGLAFARTDGEGAYLLDERLNLTRAADEGLQSRVLKKAPLARGVLSVDAASAIYTDDDGRRWRLPKGGASFDDPDILNAGRVDREVVTERDLFNCHGTFYELPARNAGGFAKIRPIATHNKHISDYCSYRGLTVLAGAMTDVEASEHLVRSDDGQVTLWVGVYDDLWTLGKPRGRGGPWRDSEVEANVPSDPYLLRGYDQKSVRLRQESQGPAAITLQVDITGDGHWADFRRFTISPGQTKEIDFPAAFSAYWLRAVADTDCVATVQLLYE